MNKISYSKTRLKDYALWYYFKYFPSNNKLIQKLTEKSENQENVQEVFSEIKHLLSEEEIIQTKIKNYLERNKNLRYIKQKLREKLFDNKQVEKYLSVYQESDESVLDYEKTKRKIENYKGRGKSINYICRKLVERDEDKVLINKCLDEVFGVDGDSENLIKEYNKLLKLKTTFQVEDIRKVMLKLQQKGFRYDDIKKLLT